MRGGTGKCLLPREQQNGRDHHGSSVIKCKATFQSFSLYTSSPAAFFSPKSGNCIAGWLVQKHLTEVALNPIKTLPCKISATSSRLVQDRCGHGLWEWCQFTQLMHYLPLSSNRVWVFFPCQCLFSVRHSRE